MGPLWDHRVDLFDTTPDTTEIDLFDTTKTTQLDLDVTQTLGRLESSNVNRFYLYIIE